MARRWDAVSRNAQISRNILSWLTTSTDNENAFSKPKHLIVTIDRQAGGGLVMGEAKRKRLEVPVHVRPP
jgi:hypothetical protein